MVERVKVTYEEALAAHKAAKKAVADLDDRYQEATKKYRERRKELTKEAHVAGMTLSSFAGQGKKTVEQEQEESRQAAIKVRVRDLRFELSGAEQQLKDARQTNDKLLIREAESMVASIEDRINKVESGEEA